jgi:hypothetical protein
MGSGRSAHRAEAEAGYIRTIQYKLPVGAKNFGIGPARTENPITRFGQPFRSASRDAKTQRVVFTAPERPQTHCGSASIGIKLPQACHAENQKYLVQTWLFGELLD